VEQNLSAAVESGGGGDDGGFSPASRRDGGFSPAPVAWWSCRGGGGGGSVSGWLASCTALDGRSDSAIIGAQLPADVVLFSTVRDPVPAVRAPQQHKAGLSNDTIQYDTIRDAILTCARKPT